MSRSNSGIGAADHLVVVALIDTALGWQLMGYKIIGFAYNASIWTLWTPNIIGPTIKVIGLTKCFCMKNALLLASIFSIDNVFYQY
mgnify:CR=1 FL=1